MVFCFGQNKKNGVLKKENRNEAQNWSVLGSGFCVKINVPSGDKIAG